MSANEKRPEKVAEKEEGHLVLVLWLWCECVGPQEM